MLTSYSLIRTFDTGDANSSSVNGQAVTGTPTYYSKCWVGMYTFGLTVVTSGTLTGTWTLWATDNPNASDADDTDWVDMSAHAEFVETNPAGSATKWRVNSYQLRAGKFRLKYVNASGTGSIYAYVTLPKTSN